MSLGDMVSIATTYYELLSGLPETLLHEYCQGQTQESPWKLMDMYM